MRFDLRVAQFTMLVVATRCLLAAGVDVLTFHNDIIRSGIQSHETLLTTANVNSAQFGKILTFAVDGDVYAQPLYVSQYTMADNKLHNVLVVATARDRIYAFDADGNNPQAGYLWERVLLGPGETSVPAADVDTSDITPSIGIIGTPAIDRSTGTIYVVAKSKTTSGSPTYIQRLHALNLADGSEKLNGPKAIQASVPGTGDGGATVAFNPLRNNQRAAVLLAPTPNGVTSGSVFIAWASHGDNGQYHGWVISYDAANVSHQTGAWADTPNGSQGGIWMSGGGLSSDGLGNIFGAAGNGSFDANDGGSDYGDSMFKLVLGQGGLALSDWFTPADQAELDGSDLDFGVGGAPLILPAQPGPVPHLMVTADKQGEIYLLNRDDLGEYNGTANTSIQSFNDGGGFSIHSNLVFFNKALYLAPDGGPASMWTFHPGVGLFSPVASSRSAHTFGCNGCDGGGSNFTISANGQQNGIAWALDYSSYGSGPVVLYAFDASNLSTELYDASQAPNQRDQATVAVKFASPTVANGKVFVGSRNAVTVYGLLSPAARTL
jgi:hypothetical protein